MRPDSLSLHILFIENSRSLYSEVYDIRDKYSYFVTYE